MTQPIDWTQPIELVGDSRAVTVKHTNYGGGAELSIAGDSCSRSYRADGRHYCNEQPRVRNSAPNLDTTKRLQTVDGKNVSFVGRLEDGRIVVQITYPSFSNPQATEIRYADGRVSTRPGVTSGDDVIVKVVEKITFRNLYADGTVGTTAHALAEDANLRSKYGKVRVGVLKQTFRDDVLFSAVVISSTIPWFRDRSAPKGRIATPADFAR